MRETHLATRPLEAVQIDHAKVDAIVVDDETGDPLGRPWLTMAFDKLTRMVTGFHLTMAPPTRLSTSLCLLHSVCDKAGWLEERGVEADWPAAGLPETVHVDRDTFFGSRAFARACRDAGIETIWRTPREPQYGECIETMIGTRLGALPLLTDARADSAGRDACGPTHAAPLTLRELETRIGSAIVGDYHERQHKGLGRTPIAAWRDHASDALFRAPVDCVKFRLSFLPEEECALHADGVHLRGQKFLSRALADDIDDGKQKIIVKFDPRDLSRIFVKRPSGRFVKARNSSLSSSRETNVPIWLNAADQDDLFEDQAFAPFASRHASLRHNSPDAADDEDGCLRAIDLRAPTFAIAESASPPGHRSYEMHAASEKLSGIELRGAPRRACRGRAAASNASVRTCARKCASSCPFRRAVC
ncbi:MAG: DDE-type integrase/transposase/recombinase [Methylocystis sp.]|nr:DDE-type integrase/transposase/recombinase [Methylocystis sp.]